MLSFFVAICNGYNVLVIAPRTGKSHFLFMTTFIQAMLDRGHQVTFLTLQSLSHLNLKNYTEIKATIPLDTKNRRKFFSVCVCVQPNKKIITKNK